MKKRLPVASKRMIEKLLEEAKVYYEYSLTNKTAESLNKLLGLNLDKVTRKLVSDLRKEIKKKKGRKESIFDLWKELRKKFKKSESKIW